jgi:hypothetical protein
MKNKLTKSANKKDINDLLGINPRFRIRIIGKLNTEKQNLKEFHRAILSSVSLC